MNRLNNIINYLLVATCVAISMCVVSCASVEKENNTMIVAHRGGAALQVENSIEAFKQSLKHEIEVIELDLHLSKDGVLIVHHDPVVIDRDGQKVPIKNLTSEYIRSLVIKNNQHIPTFEEVLTLIDHDATYQVTLFVEIKVDDTKMRYPGIEEKVLCMLDTFNLIEHSHILSFDFPTLVTMQSLHSKIKTSALISKGYMSARNSFNPIEIVQDMVLLKVSSVGIKDIYLTKSLVDALHSENILVNVWTVNDKKKIDMFVTMKVDFITSDNPILVKEVLRKN